MIDMADFQFSQSLSNSQLFQSNDYLEDEDDISVFEKQFSLNSNSLFSKENSLEDIIKPSMIPRKISIDNNDKSIRFSTPKPKSKVDSKKISSNSKKTLQKKEQIINKNNLHTGKYTTNKKKRTSKINEKVSLDSYIFESIEKSDEITNTTNNNQINESNTTINSNSNNSNNIENDGTLNNKENSTQSKSIAELTLSNKNTSKIEKYLKERYSNNGKGTTENSKKSINNNNSNKNSNNNGNNGNNARRFKLDNGAAKWILGVQVDAWRLIAGGCEGRSIFWNHKIANPIFEITKDTTNIVTIPALHAKKRKRRNQKSKYHSTN
eukprot:jgi/Orpsp1_1/1182343/evm.model.c7180000080906.1